MAVFGANGGVAVFGANGGVAVFGAMSAQFIQGTREHEHGREGDAGARRIHRCSAKSDSHATTHLVGCHAFVITCHLVVFIAAELYCFIVEQRVYGSIARLSLCRVHCLAK